MTAYADQDGDLLALLEPSLEAAVTHVLMPWMRYACGRGVVEDGGHFIVGPSQRWPEVDCQDCRAFGREELAEACARSQRDQAGAA